MAAHVAGKRSAKKFQSFQSVQSDIHSAADGVCRRRGQSPETSYFGRDFSDIRHNNLEVSRDTIRKLAAR